VNNGVDLAYWSQFNFEQQMGNVASEVGRAINYKRSKKDNRLTGAIRRATELIDLTIEDMLAKKSADNLREVLSARNNFLGLFFDNNFADADKVEDYFMQFAIAARSGR
jgi:hypothetical protein